MSSNSDSRKSRKLIKPKLSTPPTVHPETSNSRIVEDVVENKPRNKGPLCPLLAKDSEWVDIVQTSVQSVRANSSTNLSDEEEVLQLVNSVECEEGPQLKPLAIMFPDLLDKEPRTLQGVMNKTMSTTEVTRTLVDLGQKANFKFMKKTDRLIPPNKQWLESVSEYSSSYSSDVSDYFYGSGISSDFTEADESILEGEELTNPSQEDKSMEGDPAFIEISIQNIVAQVLSEMLQKICGTDPNNK